LTPLERVGPAKTLTQRAGTVIKAWIKMRQARTLSIERIGKRIGQASPEELAEIVEGFNEIIGD
jgi:mRNA interferase MazF